MAAVWATKTKTPYSTRGIDRVLIFLSAAITHVGRQTAKSVTHERCDASRMISFEEAERHRPLTDTKLHYLVNTNTSG